MVGWLLYGYQHLMSQKLSVVMKDCVVSIVNTGNNSLLVINCYEPSDNQVEDTNYFEYVDVINEIE